MNLIYEQRRGNGPYELGIKRTAKTQTGLRESAQSDQSLFVNQI